MGTISLCDRKSKRRRLEQCERSNVCQKLLTLISRGRLSIDGAVDIANCMLEDGMANSAIDSFASLGTNSKHASNCERDFQIWLKDVFNVKLQPYTLFMNLQDARLSLSLFYLCLSFKSIANWFPNYPLSSYHIVSIGVGFVQHHHSLVMVAFSPYPGRWLHAETMGGQMPLAA